MKNPIYRKLHTPPANRVQPAQLQKVNLGKLLKTRLAPQGTRPAPEVQRYSTLAKNAPVPVPAPAQAIPKHDDGSYVTEEVCDRLHREEVVASIGKVFAAGGMSVTPGGWKAK